MAIQSIKVELKLENVENEIYCEAMDSIAKLIMSSKQSSKTIAV